MQPTTEPTNPERAVTLPLPSKAYSSALRPRKSEPSTRRDASPLQYKPRNRLGPQQRSSCNAEHKLVSWRERKPGGIKRKRGKLAGDVQRLKRAEADWRRLCSCAQRQRSERTPRSGGWCKCRNSCGMVAGRGGSWSAVVGGGREGGRLAGWRARSRSCA